MDAAGVPCRTHGCDVFHNILRAAFYEEGNLTSPAFPRFYPKIRESLLELVDKPVE